MLLGLFMIRQFIQERQAARVLALEQASAPAAEPAAAAAPATEAAPSSAAPAPEKPGKKKMKLRWRTAWIWLPLLIGFFGQAYLSHVKPMLENAG
ncbi:MAG: hypothetical protein H5U13_11540 [Parvibaculum sp.]|nr:hypothetical protein [Parvibaculum sp.]